jgi:hypothetical protein
VAQFQQQREIAPPFIVGHIYGKSCDETLQRVVVVHLQPASAPGFGGAPPSAAGAAEPADVYRTFIVAFADVTTVLRDGDEVWVVSICAISCRTACDLLVFEAGSRRRCYHPSTGIARPRRGMGGSYGLADRDLVRQPGHCADPRAE